MIERNWQELIRPEKPQIEAGSDPQRKARLVAEPLERGFGVTLGNALRHAFPDGRDGRIHVTLRSTSEGFELSVADNGVGLAAGTQQSGFGLTVVQLMTQQVRGRLVKLGIDAPDSLGGTGDVSYMEGGVDPRNYRVSFDKIASTLGYEPDRESEMPSVDVPKGSAWLDWELRGERVGYDGSVG